MPCTGQIGPGTVVGSGVMATFLAYTSPALGNLLPMSALLAELARRGHRVEVRTATGGVSVVRRAGMAAAPVDARIEAIEMTDWMQTSGRAALRVALEVFGRRAPLEVDDLRAAIGDTDPDALVIDANCWGAAAAAEASGLPWLTFWPYFPFPRSPGIPPFGPGFRPWPGWPGRLRDRLLDPVVGRPVAKAMMPAVGALRSSLTLPAVGTTDELFRRAPLALVASAPPFDYPRSDDGGRLAMIGPCELDDPGPPPGWLQAIERPLVLVTTSSERQGDSALGLAAIEAMADEPVHVIATFPCGVPDSLTLPANATAVEFVSHAAVLEHAVCAVTHGGMGATQKALARGVPVCVVPFGRDQFEVARHVEVARCGTRLPSRRLTPARLRTSIVRARSLTSGARRVATGFRAAGGVCRGADIIESRFLGR